MKTPDIPQECGLIMFDGVCATIASGRGVLLNLNEPQGRAALAAYCMAVIDRLRREFFGNTQFGPLPVTDDAKYAYAYWEFLTEWYHEWSRYGGFTR